MAAPEGAEVRARPSGAPELWLEGSRWPGTLSLSHSHGRALAVLRADGGPLGADLERVEERSEAFVGDYFTLAEQQSWRDAPAGLRALVATLVWSAKECALKALSEGLRLPTGAVEVGLIEGHPPDGWGRLEARLRVEPGGAWPGYWRQDAGDVVAVVGPGLEGPPQALA